MNNYVIYTDSSSDIPKELLLKWGVRAPSLTFRFTDSAKEYTNDEMNISEFYSKMRQGGVAKTAAVNSESFIEAFNEALSAGDDVLYLGFSSGLSTTCNSARIAAGELSQKYPERRIIIVDTLCASAGGALLVNMVVKKKEGGASIEEAAAYAEERKLHIDHWFTVDDLVYLKRGGRISATAAFFGNMLGIKPVLHVDNEGHLVPVCKVRGRRTSITALADKYAELCEDCPENEVYISHSDCLADAEQLANLIEAKYGKKTTLITDVGPVIGAHSGPGTIALFFVGRER